MNESEILWLKDVQYGPSQFVAKPYHASVHSTTRKYMIVNSVTPIDQQNQKERMHTFAENVPALLRRWLLQYSGCAMSNEICAHNRQARLCTRTQGGVSWSRICLVSAPRPSATYGTSARGAMSPVQCRSWLAIVAMDPKPRCAKLRLFSPPPPRSRARSAVPAGPRTRARAAGAPF